MTAAAVTRDLHWAIHGPFLCGEVPPGFLAWRDKAKEIVVPSELIDHRRTPIGRYFERLVALWLEQQPEIQRLETNLVLSQDKQTLGELDLLFACKDTAYHWELAVKLYLGVGDRRQAASWFGPLGRDRLDLKWAKLHSHQLRLLDTSAGRGLLEERGIRSCQSFTFFKGYLFHPFAQWIQGHFAAPSIVPGDHGKGWWTHLHSASEPLDRHARWAVLLKADWLAPAVTSHGMSSEEIFSHLHCSFLGDTRPILVAALDEEGLEIERGFVVPDDWKPQTERTNS